MSSIKYKDPSTGKWLTIVNIDTTLSQSGHAADAKAIGDALSVQDERIAALEQSGGGKDGYTPVRGTDYWTEADQAQIVSDVLEALPAWEGGSY